MQPVRWSDSPCILPRSNRASSSILPLALLMPLSQATASHSSVACPRCPVIKERSPYLLGLRIPEHNVELQDCQTPTHCLSALIGAACALLLLIATINGISHHVSSFLTLLLQSRLGTCTCHWTAWAAWLVTHFHLEFFGVCVKEYTFEYSMSAVALCMCSNTAPQTERKIVAKAQYTRI
jgi:hypothetical protein